MADKFDDLREPTRRRYSRRSMFRLAGAGVLGVTAAALPGVASADGQFERTSRLWFVNVNGQNFNTLEPFCWWKRGEG